MKKHLSFIFVFTLLTFGIHPLANAHEPTLEGELIQVIFPQEAPIQGMHLCLTYLKTLNGHVALVEDSSSCHYARRFRNQVGNWVRAEAPSDSYVEDSALKELLEQIAPKATFLILDSN